MDADACAEDSGSAGRDPGHIEIRGAVYFGESAIQTSSAGNDERRREMAGRQLRPVEHDRQFLPHDLDPKNKLLLRSYWKTLTAPPQSVRPTRS